MYLSFKLRKIRNSQSETLIFFECKTNGKSILKLENQALVVNAGTSLSLSQETVQIPTNAFRCKEKMALKQNNLNDKKARSE